MDVKIETSKYNVLTTGSVIIPKNDNVTISIDKLHFRFSFQNDENPNGEKSRYILDIEKNDDGEDVMDIAIHNMQTSFFATPSDRIKVGHYNGKELLLQFSLVAINSGEEHEQLLFYTFYQQKN